MLWWVLPGALLIGAAAWGTAQWLLQGLPHLPIPQQVSTRIEALRTALAAAAGVGAGVTLLLAVRRQRHQEVATWHVTHDAAERRVTELYAKAVEQLGNAQAPVRLGGLYALERLGKDNPTLRQTIVDVICAYLRMPYQLPDEEKSETEPAVPRAAVGGVTKPAPTPTRDPHEERQVRLTAQRILADHLRYRALDTHRWWQPRPADPNLRYWADIRLDLTGAILVDLDLGNCRISDARFGGTTFSGNTRFNDVTFTRDAGFDGVTFTRDAGFNDATFTRDAGFDGVTFTGAVQFDGATFTRDARFDGATFCGDVRFDDAMGVENVDLSDVRVAPVAAKVKRRWPSAWREEDGADGWQTLRLATPEELAQADGEGNMAEGG
ncbi:pentapeptide repeat-containing protein [Nonomuraea sp. NPDC050394]|uniref:pentapeptide repeat-containing protein n=1 Tax=Nonomuraea sp. NPDC050394 TaxID=3364363 RepID=UPI0037AF7DDE